MALVLIVDDEARIREMLQAALVADGHSAVLADSAAAALAVLDREAIDLLITDLSMPSMSGLELLHQVSRLSPDTPAIVITAFGSKESAIEAMRHGAVNYLEKPFDVEEMQLHVRRALGHQSLSDENRRLKIRLAVQTRLLGRSPRMQELRQLVERIAPTDSTVLITGESGSGKEVVARAIHSASPRSERPFVGVNCGAIPAELLESELFGHVKGAFTGADRSRHGLVEAAEGGTLFLDEIGDMPGQMQVKLLRVLQERRIRRVGGSEEIPVNVRVITATHRDLDGLVREEQFREDLYYRINVIRVRVPALREHIDDLPEFVRHFIDKHAKRMGRPGADLSPELLRAFSGYHWPGNVRELENVVERVLALSGGGSLPPEALPPEIRGGQGRLADKAGASEVLDSSGEFDLERHLEQQRREFMEQALLRAGGVQTKAAERLGMTFRSFRYFAKKYGLTSRGSGGDSPVLAHSQVLGAEEGGKEGGSP